MRRPLALILVCYVAATVPVQAADGIWASQLGFGYCSPPVVPGCIDAEARRPSRSVRDACSRDVLRFTQTLGSYRACLTRESERAIGSGNTAIARFRCLSQGGTACP